MRWNAQPGRWSRTIGELEDLLFRSLRRRRAGDGFGRSGTVVFPKNGLPDGATGAPLKNLQAVQFRKVVLFFSGGTLQELQEDLLKKWSTLRNCHACKFFKGHFAGAAGWQFKKKEHFTELLGL